jgi:hypothetical protein
MIFFGRFEKVKPIDWRMSNDSGTNGDKSQARSA